MGLFQWLENFSGGGQAPELRRPEDEDSRVRRRFQFYGRVQGVGFRYEARMTAAALNLTGWARNETDGSVTVEAEGPEACVEEFLRVMKAVPRFRVSEVRAESQPVSGKEKGFGILY